MSTTIINYDAVVQELIKGVKLNDERHTAANLGLDKTDWRYLTELRTIGFYTPRQLGRTNWLIKNFQFFAPDALIVVATPSARAIVMSSLDVSMYLPGDTGQRVVVASELAALPQGQRYRYVFIDDASILFANYVKHAAFHRTLADHVTDDVVIVRIN